MLDAVFSSSFKKDYKLMKRRGLNISELIKAMKLLESETPLETKHNEHQLTGNYKNFLECHIQPDWLLIYRIDRNVGKIYFTRTGTHSDLFG